MGKVGLFGHGTKGGNNGRAAPINEVTPFPASGSDGLIWLMSGGDVASIYGRFPVPSDYLVASHTPTIRIEWTADVTSGTILWGITYAATGGDNVESLIGSLSGVSEVQDTAPGSSGRKMICTLPLTASDFLAHDTVRFKLYRDPFDVLDSGIDAYLYDAYFEY